MFAQVIWFPETASSTAGRVDRLFIFLLSTTGAVGLLVAFLLIYFAVKYRRPIWRPDGETLRDFCEFDWPGNIRQLSHVIEQSYVLDSLPTLPRAAADNRGPTSLPFFNLARLRNEAVRQALAVTRGHKGRAAKLLGVHANTLTRLISMPEPDGDAASS